MDVAINLGNYKTKLIFSESSPRIHTLLKGVASSVPEYPDTLLVPSLISLGEEVAIGEEVLLRGLYDKDSTFHDLKDHTVHPAPVARSFDDKKVTYKEAAAIFLGQVVKRLQNELNEPLNLVLFYPTVEGSGFRDWLRSVDFSMARSVTIVDEDTAVAWGYDINLYQDDLLLFFDFGFSSIRARLVQFHWRGREAYQPPFVRASVVTPVGSADIKQRILRELHADEADRKLPPFYWKRFVLHEDTFSDVTPEQFQQFIEKENLAGLVQQTIDRLWEEASARGIQKEDVKKVCLIGGGTRIPAVRLTLEQNFKGRILSEFPEVAACRGGLHFLSARPVDDMVRYDYSMKVRDPISGERHYPVVVEKYTRYPTKGAVSRYIVNTYFDGQYEIFLEIYRTVQTEDDLGSREVVFDEKGWISLVNSRTSDVRESVGEPIVIPVQPAGRVGERRVLLEFSVDSQKRLVLSARDLREEKTLWEDRPIVSLQ